MIPTVMSIIVGLRDEENPTHFFPKIAGRFLAKVLEEVCVTR
jgi:hypothetical protein